MKVQLTVEVNTDDDAFVKLRAEDVKSILFRALIRESEVSNFRIDVNEEN